MTTVYLRNGRAFRVAESLEEVEEQARFIALRFVEFTGTEKGDEYKLKKLRINPKEIIAIL